MKVGGGWEVEDDEEGKSRMKNEEKRGGGKGKREGGRG